MAHIAVCGAGGWGTALAVMASRFGQDVALWSPFEEEIEGIRRHGEHKKLLPGIPVPRDVRLTSDLACAADADLVLLSVPSFAVGQTAEKLRPHLRPDTVVANAGKGLEEATLRRFSDILTDKLAGHPGGSPVGPLPRGRGGPGACPLRWSARPQTWRRRSGYRTC